MSMENSHLENTPDVTEHAKGLAEEFGPFTLIIQDNFFIFKGRTPEADFKVKSKKEAREILTMGQQAGFFNQESYDKYLKDVNSSTLSE